MTAQSPVVETTDDRCSGGSSRVAVECCRLPTVHAVRWRCSPGTQSPLGRGGCDRPRCRRANANLPTLTGFGPRTDLQRGSNSRCAALGHPRVPRNISGSRRMYSSVGLRGAHRDETGTNQFHGRPSSSSSPRSSIVSRSEGPHDTRGTPAHLPSQPYGGASASHRANRSTSSRVRSHEKPKTVTVRGAAAFDAGVEGSSRPARATAALLRGDLISINQNVFLRTCGHGVHVLRECGARWRNPAPIRLAARSLLLAHTWGSAPGCDEFRSQVPPSHLENLGSRRALRGGRPADAGSSGRSLQEYTGVYSFRAPWGSTGSATTAPSAGHER